MGMNALKNLAETLQSGTNEIMVAEDIRKRALKPLEKMVNFANKH
jgi:quinolinate synthase